MNIHRVLSAADEIEFRMWARKNYKYGDKIESVWHPVIIHEIGLMLMEGYQLQKRTERAKGQA